MMIIQTITIVSYIWEKTIDANFFVNNNFTISLLYIETYHSSKNVFLNIFAMNNFIIIQINNV